MNTEKKSDSTDFSDSNDFYEKLLASSERVIVSDRTDLKYLVAVGGAAAVIGGLALRTATLDYPTKNLGGYVTAQKLLPSFMAGPGLSETIKTLGGPLPAALAGTIGICGLGLLLYGLFE